jgi:uncharacterized membrane protein
MTLSKLGQLPVRTVFALLVGLVLMGCCLYPDVNTYTAKNNKETFRQDAMDCAQSYPESGSGVHVKQRIACMNLKGWH